MHKAIEERGTSSNIKFALFTEKKPFEFMTSPLCRKDLWQACGMDVLFSIDFYELGSRKN